MSAPTRLCPALVLAFGVSACQDHIVVGDSSADEAPTFHPEGTHGLRGRYWNNLELSGPVVLERVDGAEQVWQGSPGPGLSETFSARFEGFLLPPSSETYQLRLDSDDGSRLWLGEQLLVDQWRGAPNSATGSVSLQAGEPLFIRLELYSLGGAASFQLYWESPTRPREVVPSESLRVP